MIVVSGLPLFQQRVVARRSPSCGRTAACGPGRRIFLGEVVVTRRLHRVLSQLVVEPHHVRHDTGLRLLGLGRLLGRRPAMSVIISCNTTPSIVEAPSRRFRRKFRRFHNGILADSSRSPAEAMTRLKGEIRGEMLSR